MYLKMAHLFIYAKHMAFFIFLNIIKTVDGMQASRVCLFILKIELRSSPYETRVDYNIQKRKPTSLQSFTVIF